MPLTVGYYVRLTLWLWCVVTITWLVLETFVEGRWPPLLNSFPIGVAVSFTVLSNGSDIIRHMKWKREEGKANEQTGPLISERRDSSD